MYPRIISFNPWTFVSFSFVLLSCLNIHEIIRLFWAVQLMWPCICAYFYCRCVRVCVCGLFNNWNTVLHQNSTCLWLTHVKSFSAWLGGRQPETAESVCAWRDGKQARRRACTSANATDSKSIQLNFEGFQVALGSCTQAGLCYLALHMLC